MKTAITKLDLIVQSARTLSARAGSARGLFARGLFRATLALVLLVQIFLCSEQAACARTDSDALEPAQPSTQADSPKDARSAAEKETLKEKILKCEPIKFRMAKDKRICSGKETYNGENAIHIYLNFSDQPVPYVVTLGWFVFLPARAGDVKLLDEFGERIPLPYFPETRPGFNKADLMAIKGFDLLSDGKLKLARKEIEQALSLAPASAKLHNNMGVIHALSGELGQAQKEFQKALRLKKDYAGALSNMAWLAIVIDQPMLAEKDASGAMKIDSDMAPARLAFARAKLNLKESPEPESAIRTLTKMKSKDANALELLAEAQLAEGDLKGARQTYLRLARARPEDSNTLLKIAHTSSLLGDLDDAIMKARQATEIAANDPNSHYKLGEYLEQNRDLKAAYLQFLVVLELCSKSKERHFEEMRIDVQGPILRTLVQARELSEADRLSKKWAKESGGVFSCQFNRAWIAAQLPAKEALKEAIVHYQKALALKPDLNSARYNLALVLIKDGKSAEGKKELKRFLSAAPHDPDAARAGQLLAELEADGEKEEIR